MLIKSEKAELVSQWLMDIKAISFRTDPPYIFTSGWKSPVYVNCRKPISHVVTRRAIVDLAVQELGRHEALGDIDCIAGGETAGIPYAAWISEAFSKPMVYVRKKQKEFGLQEHVVGDLTRGSTCVLVEDLNTDGKSKVHFASVLEAAGAKLRTVVCVFNYGVFPGVEETFTESGLDLLYLTDWPTTIQVGLRNGYFQGEQAREVQNYLDDPVAWSKSRS